MTPADMTPAAAPLAPPPQAQPTAPTPNGRSEKELLLATRDFTAESTAKSWGATLSTFAILAGLTAGALFAPTWWLKLAFSVVEGLTVVRTFCLFHDFYHGTILRQSKAAELLYWVYGTTILVPASVWKETHDYHHAHTAKMVGSHIGSYPVVTVGMWNEMSAGQKLGYKLVRHPLNMVLAVFTVFTIGMCLKPFFRSPAKHWGGLVSFLFVYGAWATLTAMGYGQQVFFAWFLPCAIGMAAGAYLFYAQHNFPDAHIASRQEWTFSGAAMESSSYFVMPAFMHWFTANIGYHHVHHLNAAIPFYRLPEAMAGIPELQHPGQVSWKPSSIAANFKLDLWDPQANRMVGYPN
jgi:omega-6 fatty acid desaturase (delta-12 desaturase)